MDMGDVGESFSSGLARVRSGLRGSDDEHDILPFRGVTEGLFCEAFVFSFPSELVQRHGDGEELLQRQLGATIGGELRCLRRTFTDAFDTGMAGATALSVTMETLFASAISLKTGSGRAMRNFSIFVL
jgi:hypothetical protein